MKLCIDIVLFILMIIEFSRSYMPPILHEIIGIFLIMLVIFHLYLNKNYIKNIFKGKYNLKRMIMLIINMLFIVTFLSSCVLGILSSEVLLPFLNIGSLSLVSLHKVTAYISILIMGLHLGINFDSMFSVIQKKIKKRFLLDFISIFIIIIGIYSFIKLNFWMHLTWSYGFSTNEGNILINFLEYASLVMTNAIITNKIYKKIK